MFDSFTAWDNIHEFAVINKISDFCEKCLFNYYLNFKKAYLELQTQTF